MKFETAFGYGDEIMYPGGYVRVTAMIIAVTRDGESGVYYEIRRFPYDAQEITHLEGSPARFVSEAQLVALSKGGSVMDLYA